MKAKPTTRRRQLLAVALLAIGGLVFAGNVLPLLQAPRPVETGNDPGDEEPLAAAAAELGDLLPAFGSYRPGTPVRQAFAAANPQAPAAPGPETAAAWRGADPPSLQVGFVMVGGAVARAVVDGVVVGVGDRIGDGTVAAIRRDGVLLRLSGRLLTYGLDSAWPREFAAELQRRGQPATSEGIR